MLELAQALLEEQRQILLAYSRGEEPIEKVDELHRQMDLLLSWIEAGKATKH